jgi:formiminotetrahydrofolate cyclodeaminase
MEPNMKLIDRTVHELLAAFRTSAPTPGGGSASALTGATGASLLTMVAGLPKPVASTAEDIQDLHRAGARCSELALQLETLIDKDADAYGFVVAAYRMPKGTDEEQRARSASIQEGMRAAIATPLEVMRACSSALEEASVIARLGNRNAASDVKVALGLLQAGLRGALENVDINLGTVKDQAYAADVKAETAGLLDGAGELARRAVAAYQ